MSEGEPFGWSFGETKELKAERSAKEILLSNLSSAISLFALMGIATFIVFGIPLAVILWKVAL
jgi:hypothetical protein